MLTPTPDEIARAFELGNPDGGLTHVRRGDADAWRLDTSTGSYFVKGYLQDVTDQLTVAMAFEGRALEAGLDMPEPVEPADPVVGWAARVEDRLFRVHRWIEPLSCAPDVDIWLGRTMAQVHQLEPLGGGDLPEWWRQAIKPPAVWDDWIAEARSRDVGWADRLSDSLPLIHAATARLAELCDNGVPDLVTTRGDFKPHNIVRSLSGPVLVDWDSVRTDSAALEAGRTAYIFGGGDPERIRGILAAYVDAGGALAWAGPDLFLSVARNHLQVLSDLVQASLGQTAAAPWMGDRRTIDDAIGNRLQDLSSRLEGRAG